MRLGNFTFAGTLASALAVTACSGGGGGGSSPGGGSVPTAGPTATPTIQGSATPHATPTATPSPSPSPSPIPGVKYALPTASPIVLSAFAIDSNPRGLAVTINGSPSPAGTTLLNESPPFSNTPYTIAIAPNASFTPNATASPFVVTLTQTAGAPVHVYYNQTLDTLGAISSVSASPEARRRSVRNLAKAAAFGAHRTRTSLHDRAQYSSNRVAVTYDLARLGNRSVASIEGAHGARSAVTIAQSSAFVTRAITLSPGRTVDAAITALRGESGVASVSRVGLRYPMGSAGAPVYPNDPEFVDGEQWYLDPVIDMPDAWSYTLGNPAISVAVVDSGYDPNQTEVAPLVTVAEKIQGGYLYKATPPGFVSDTDGHGTFVSGLISAQTNNDAGFAGIGYGLPLQEYEVYSGTDETADTADEAEAIREAAANGAHVILVPLGGQSSGGPDPLERDAINYALSLGIVVIAPSGNEGNTTADYPAALQGVIDVGASAVNDSGTPGTVVGGGNFEYVPTYSNVDPNLDVVAPGGDPTGASDPDIIHWIKNSYTTTPAAGLPACPAGTAPADCSALFSGTSASAAEVAGVAGLMLSANDSLTPAQIQTILDSTADQIVNASATPDPKQGHGRLNAHRAMAAVEGDPSPMPAVPLPSFVQFRAFAYSNSGAMTPVAPTIIDLTYPNGVPVSSNGTFRIADLPVPTTGTWKIGVWVDMNGDGKIDAGDYFGAVSSTCSTRGPCANATRISVGVVPSGFKLP